MPMVYKPSLQTEIQFKAKKDASCYRKNSIYKKFLLHIMLLCNTLKPFLYIWHYLDLNPY